MKGISTIIASIILVVITIGLIATAYLYFSGIVSVGAVVAIASGSCNGTDITISIRNDGTAQLDLAFDNFVIDGTTLIDADLPDDLDDCLDPLAATASGSCVITQVGGTDVVSGVYNLAIYGPRNTAAGPITC